MIDQMVGLVETPLPGMIVILFVWGVFPSTMTRLASRCYRRGDPARREVLGALKATSRLERPFWALEQIEQAIFAGLVPRIRHRLSERRNIRKRRGRDGA